MNTADVMINVHPEFDLQTRTGLERILMSRVGIDCAEFTDQTHYHALMVKYDPEAVEGMEILQMVRRLDPAASMVGL